MDIQEVRKIVGKIKGSLFKNSNGFSIGMLKSHFKGSGLQFKEHMVYSHGDDVRFIDWKLTAKTQNTFVKTFEEERNVEIVVVLDLSPSMFMGYKGISKLQASLEICCLLLLLSNETNDYVQVVILANETVSLPKATGEKGIALLISKLEDLKVLNPNGQINTNYQNDKGGPAECAGANTLKYIRRNKEVVILSDFIDFLEFDELKKLAYRKHVHCFRIVGPLDDAIDTPFEVYSRSSLNSKGSLSSINMNKADNLDQFLGKRIKTLNVKDRYLESFIKEML